MFWSKLSGIFDLKKTRNGLCMKDLLAHIKEYVSGIVESVAQLRSSGIHMISSVPPPLVMSNSPQ